MWTRARIGQTWVMNFRLEKWEVPPGADIENVSVPIEFGPVEWNSEQTRVSARWLEFKSGEALAFFRPHCDAINYVVTREDETLLHMASKHVNSKILGQTVRSATCEEQSHFGRLFYIHGEYLIFREGQGLWESQDYWQRESPLEIPFDANTTASIDVFDWLQAQWNDVDSEVRIAWEWNRKTEPEQTRWLGTIVPRWNELHDLMRAAACVAELPTGERWILNHFDTHNHAPELLGRLQPLRKLFQARFSFAPLAESYPEFLREYFAMAARHVQVIGEEFSAHERLEAALFLRDWLAHNAPEQLDLI